LTTEATFLSLEQCLQGLRESLEMLGTTIEQDRPECDDVIVTSRMTDAVLAATGHLQGAIASAQEARGAVAGPLDAVLAQRALTRSQEQFHRFATFFHTELHCFDRFDDLRSIGEERGRPWQDWAMVVTEALGQGERIVEETRTAFLRSWKSLTERMTAVPATVQVTNVPLWTETTARAAKAAV
jgi:hypothetical protein